MESCGLERDWPEARGIYHNDAKTFLVWVNEEDQLRIISMQQGADVKEVFDRLARGIKAVEESIYKECQGLEVQGVFSLSWSLSDLAQPRGEENFRGGRNHIA